ncbi:MAG: hypothetical protein R3293_15830 [Candidatus Promineifilaceae bacterium]|nr:hypothetical protein [Candidatus Promineifilaceae bacterium]
MRFQQRQAVHQGPGQGVDALNARLANHKAARVPHRGDDLDPNRKDTAARCVNRLKTRRGLLHQQRARHRPRAIVAVKPARERIAAEDNHAAAIGVHLLDQRVIDLIQMGRQLLRPMLRAQLIRQRFRQRRKTGNIRHQRRPPHPVRQRPSFRQRRAPVLRDINPKLIHKYLSSNRPQRSRRFGLSVTCFLDL